MSLDGLVKSTAEKGANLLLIRLPFRKDVFEKFNDFIYQLIRAIDNSNKIKGQVAVTTATAVPSTSTENKEQKKIARVATADNQPISSESMQADSSESMQADSSESMQADSSESMQAKLFSILGFIDMNIILFLLCPEHSED